ncbi:MAG: efflux RND transporter periplasmic adaptor subunit [Chloroflexota bacterium]|nr:efflux RND transporter periplasmic adaptor subunit [Chloroflexota bacterium]
MRRTMLNVILGAVIVAAVAGAIFWWLQTSAPPDEEGQVRSAVVERGTVQVGVSASGSIEPQARVGLAFEVPGRVAEVLVEMGDAVEAGDVLVRLDDGQLALQVQQAEAALAAAEAQLAQLQVGARPEEVAAAEAQLQAVQFQVSAVAATRDQLEAGASDAQVAAAEADLASAITQQRMAEDMHEKTMTCVTFELPYGMGQDKICPALGPIEEQARYGLNAADKALAAAQAGLDEALGGSDADQIRAARANVAAAVAQRDAMQAQLDLLLAGASEEQIAATAAFVAQAQAALELAELMLERATLYAPFDGLIAAVNVTEGQITGGGVPAITLVDSSRFRVTVEVDEVDVAELSEELPVEVMLDALPDVVLDGTVERIAPATTRLASIGAGGLAAMGGGISSMGTAGLSSLGAGISSPGIVSYDMIIALDETDAPVRAGMSASVIVMVEEVTDVLLLPTWLVRIDRDTGQTYVQRQAGAQTERVDVQLGVRGDGVVQVISGLEEGDVILLIQESIVETIQEAR